jgi:hypothetical protein
MNPVKCANGKHGIPESRKIVCSMVYKHVQAGKNNTISVNRAFSLNPALRDKA